MNVIQRLRHTLSNFNTAFRGSNRYRRRMQNRSHEAAAIESLEKRELLAANIALSGGVLTITADLQGSGVTVIDHDPQNLSRRGIAGFQPLLTVVAGSNDGTVVQPIHKSLVQTIRFNGSFVRDTYIARTGIGWNWLTIAQTVNAGNGDDYIETGWGNDTINGSFGDDTIKSGSGNDTIDGGFGDDDIWAGNGHDDVTGGYHRDEIWGGSGNDVLRGGEGVDDLFGEEGDDTLYGESGEDWLEGGADNDHLFGGFDTDLLYGGSGIDGLYGGRGADYLHGGADPDRFLLYMHETDTDQITDFDDRQDVHLRFRNSSQQTRTWSDGTTSVFNAGTWQDNDIERIDAALGVMAEATGNNVLLRKSNGVSINLYRHGTVDNSASSINAVAYNSGGATYYSWQNFTQGDDWLNQVIFHEFGHNWDRSGEIDDILSSSWASSINGGFRSASGWRQGSTNPNPLLYTQSDDGRWWHLTNRDFARDYGTFNPDEDWATTFAGWFMNEAGRTYTGTAYRGTDVGFGANTTKDNRVGDLVAQIRNLGPNGPIYAWSLSPDLARWVNATAEGPSDVKNDLPDTDIKKDVQVTKADSPRDVKTTDVIAAVPELGKRVKKEPVATKVEVRAVSKTVATRGEVETVKQPVKMREVLVKSKSDFDKLFANYDKELADELMKKPNVKLDLTFDKMDLLSKKAVA